MTRKKTAILAGAALAAAAILTSVAAAEHMVAKSVTVQGEVLDMACYLAHDGHGPGHAACAKKCLKQGQPMGLLAKDGTVYLLFADHADASAFDATKGFAGQNVEIKGEPAEKSGIKGITVQGVKPV